MSWRYIPTDKNELSHLLALKEYFLENLWSKEKDWKYAKSLEKWGLPNWRTEIIRRSVGVEVAHNNLSEVNLAIINHPDYT